VASRPFYPLLFTQISSGSPSSLLRNQTSVSFFGTIETVTSFFRASPKRTAFLTHCLPGNSNTRWMSRSKSITTFDSHYDDIITALQNIIENSRSDPSTIVEAVGHVTRLQDIYTVFLLKFFRRVFGFYDILTTYLQSATVDPGVVARKLEVLANCLLSMRTDNTFQTLWESAEVLMPHIPRQRRANVSHFLDSGYTVSASNEIDVKTECRSITLEIVDCLTQQLAERFSDVNRFEWLKLVHFCNFVDLSSNHRELTRLISNFTSTYPKQICDLEKLKLQLLWLYTDVEVTSLLQQRGVVDCATLLEIFFECKLYEPLPHVCTLLIFGVTIPITSGSCERHFSVLKRVKNYQRNTMNQPRLKQLMMLSTEKSIVRYLATKPDFYDNIIDVFANMKDRRIKLVYKH
jgi:hypothetical protein